MKHKYIVISGEEVIGKYFFLKSAFRAVIKGWRGKYPSAQIRDNNGEILHGNEQFLIMKYIREIYSGTKTWLTN